MIPSSELSSRVAAIPYWCQRMDPGEVVTPGHTDPSKSLTRLKMPDSFCGKTVLDIGAWDGFYSFEAERRGAALVLATDSFCWGGGGPGTKAGFELAREALGTGVADMTIDVLDLSPPSEWGSLI